MSDKIKNISIINPITSNNLDDFTRTGFYEYTENMTNRPSSAYNGNMIVISGSKYVHQVLLEGNAKIWMRRYDSYSGLWNNWNSVQLS